MGPFCVGQRQPVVDRRVEGAGRELLDHGVDNPLAPLRVAVEGVPGETAHGEAFSAPRAQGGEQLVFGQSGQRVVRNDHAERRQHVEAVGKPRPDELIEGQIDAASAGEFQHLLGDFVTAVVDRVGGAEPADEGALLVGTGAADNVDALGSAQIDDRRTHASGRAVHIGGFGVHAAGGLEQQGPGDDIVGNGDRIVEIDTIGQRRDQGYGHRVVLGIASAAGAEHQHRLTHFETADTGPDRLDMAAHFVAEDRRQGRFPAVNARAQKIVGFADTDRRRAHQHLALARARCRQVDDLDDLRSAIGGNLDGFHIGDSRSKGNEKAAGYAPAAGILVAIKAVLSGSPARARRTSA